MDKGRPQVKNEYPMFSMEFLVSSENRVPWNQGSQGPNQPLQVANQAPPEARVLGRP